MTWRDRLVPASLDDAPFFVLSASQDDGRRTHVQKFPGRAEVEVQDLGFDSREFDVRAYLIGDDYDLDRDFLETTLTSGGRKRLSIPWRGSKDVYVIGRIRTEESKSEGGYCTISFKCVEAVPAASFERVDRSATLDQQADATIAAASEDFAETFSVAGLPAANQVSTVEAFDAASEAMQVAAKRINGVIGTANEARAVIDDFNEGAESLFSDGEALVASMAEVVGAVVGIGDAALDTANLAASLPARTQAAIVDATVTGVETILAFADDLIAISTATATGETEATNRGSVVDTFQVIGLAEACRATTNLPFESRQQAQDVRGRLVTAFDDELGDLSDAVYDAVLLLRANLVQHLDEVAAGLPDLVNYTVPRLASTSEIAQDFYGDGSRADDIETRNRIGSPLFVPAGTVLELLSV